MRPRALDVEAAPLRPRQRPRRGDVDGGAEQADGEDERALHRGRMRQALDRLDADHAGQHEQRRAVDLRAEDLRAPEPEREAAGGRPRRQPQRRQREPDRPGVGEHVRRVGEQRQRGGQQARHDLDRHEAEDQREREPQLAAVGAGEIAWAWL